MWWFVNIGIMVFGFFAQRAIANYLMKKQKPPAPEGFTNPLTPQGNSLPVLYGTRRVRGITTWFGEAQLVEKNVDWEGAFDFTRRPYHVAYMYKLTMEQVFCWGTTSAINNMIFGDRAALSDQPSPQTFDLGIDTPLPIISPAILGSEVIRVSGISPFFGVFVSEFGLWLPQLYGGKLRGGGVTAVYGDNNEAFGNRFRFYAGKQGYDPDPTMERFLGAGNVPGYDGLIRLVYDQVNVGANPVPEPIDLILECDCPIGIPGGSGSERINDRWLPGKTFAWHAFDVDIASCIYNMLVDPVQGLGEPASMIAGGGLFGDTFEHAKRAFVAEGLGVSVITPGGRQAAQATIDDLLDTGEAVLNRDPASFQRKIKLIRDEAPDEAAYAAIRQLTENHIKELEPWSRNDWADTFNSVTIKFSNAENFYLEDTVGPFKNQAAIAMSGKERPITITYQHVTDKEVATRLGLRDLKKLSLRLWRGKAKITREAWDLERGDVFRMFFAPKKVNDMLVRVLGVDMGTESSGYIVADVIQDVFGFNPSRFTGDLPVAVPVNARTIVRPVIVGQSKTVVAGNGQGTITLSDPERRVYEVAYRTIVGGGAPSAWTVVSSATPNSADPDFPFINPVTDDDFNGDIVFTVPLSYDGEGQLQYRLKYVGFGTAADPFENSAELLGGFVWSATPRPPSAPGVSSDSKIRWTTDGGGGALIVGYGCEATARTKPGKIVGWSALVSPAATIGWDIWKKNGGSPTVADSLGVASVMKLVGSTNGSGTFATPFPFAVGDIIKTVVDHNNLATHARVELLLQYD